MFKIGDKVVCVDSSKASHIKEEVDKDFSQWVVKGEHYTVRGFNENDGIVVGVLLEEIHNTPLFFKLLGRSQEPAFKMDRFRKLKPSEQLETIYYGKSNEFVERV